jgi:fused signal recognition particle receptor
MNVFQKIGASLKKTREQFTKRLNALFSKKIDSDFFDNLEEILITSDIGMETSEFITETLRKRVREQKLETAETVRAELIAIIAGMLTDEIAVTEETTAKPQVILVIGVNGAGKTTTIGKLSKKYTAEGKRVIIAAADTFRAAAVEQIDIWAKRAGAELIKRPEGTDPASVVYDALEAMKAKHADVLIIDTAGRLHNKKPLMDELKKIRRIISDKGVENVETLLVLDATTGQNAVNQARLFNEVCGVTGIVLTKLDGTAKGGIIIPIVAELKIPVRYIGTGEQADDLSEFDPVAFTEGLFENDTDHDDSIE